MSENKDLPNGLLFKIINIKLTNLVNTSDDNLGIPAGQSRVLHYLMRHADKPVTPKQIAGRFAMTGATVSWIMSRMEENGLITLEANPDDRRSKLIFLTEKGKNAVDTTRQFLDHCEEVLTDGFDDEEKAQLKEYLNRVWMNLRKESEKE